MRKAVALFIAAAFLFNSVGGDFFVTKAWAAKGSMELPSVGSMRTGSPAPLKELDVDTFSLPQGLGHIQGSCKAANTKKVVIHIQDAHCNYAAQKKIGEIIAYLNKEYGIAAVNLEGGRGAYNLSVFNDIDDKEVRDKVADYFVKEGEVNGAEYFAITSPEKIKLWGVEDTELYIKNLNVYRESLSYKGEVDKYLKELNAVLGELKKKIYSDELIELDTRYDQYKTNVLGLKDYISYIIQKAERRIIDVKSFPNIYLLGQTLDQEDAIDFKKADIEKDDLIDKFKKTLSKNELEELIGKIGQFKIEKISQYEFYTYLVKKARSINIALDTFPELQRYIIYLSLYSAVDKTKIAKEMTALEDAIKETLYENDDERTLAVLSKNLTLTKNIFAITLTKDDYEYYKSHVEAFDMSNYLSFVTKEAQAHAISKKLDDRIRKLDKYRDRMAQFYEYSSQRDAAFVRNIKFTDYDRPNSIIITGGFHTENLCNLFKNNDISYVSIMPNFKNEKEYESPYMRRLAGQKTPLENIIDSTIPAVLNIQVVSKLNTELGAAVEGEDSLKRFELAVMIVGAIMRGRSFIVHIPKKFLPQGKNDEDKAIIFTKGKGEGVGWEEKFASHAGYPSSFDAVVTNLQIAGSGHFDYALSKKEAGPKVAVTTPKGEPAPGKGHAGFGLSIKADSKAYDTEEAIATRQADLRSQLDRGELPAGFSRETVQINGVTVNVVVDTRLLEERIRGRANLQQFFDRCINIRGDRYRQRLQADLVTNLRGRPLILDYLDRSPNLYGDCQQNAYIYVNARSPVMLDAVGISHELMHEAGIFGNEMLPEAELAEEDLAIIANPEMDIDLRQVIQDLEDIIDRFNSPLVIAQMYVSAGDILVRSGAITRDVVISDLDNDPVVSRALGLLGHVEDVRDRLRKNGVAIIRGPPREGFTNAVFVENDPLNVARQIQRTLNIQFWHVDTRLEFNQLIGGKTAITETDIQTALAELDLENDINHRLPSEVVERLRYMSGDQSLAVDNFTGSVQVSFYTSASHKIVFQLSFARKGEGAITVACPAVYKKPRSKGAITEKEMHDLELLQIGELSCVPKIGWRLASGQGYTEEFIPGPTAYMLLARSPITGEELTLHQREQIVEAALRVGHELNGVPRDLHGKNFIIDEGRDRAVLVDLGERRVDLSLIAQTQDMRTAERNAMRLVSLLVGYYGYDHLNNDFVYQRIDTLLPNGLGRRVLNLAHDYGRRMTMYGMGTVVTAEDEEEEDKDVMGERHKAWIKTAADLSSVVEDLGKYLSQHPNPPEPAKPATKPVKGEGEKQKPAPAFPIAFTLATLFKQGQEVAPMIGDAVRWDADIYDRFNHEDSSGLREVASGSDLDKARQALEALASIATKPGRDDTDAAMSKMEQVIVIRDIALARSELSEYCIGILGQILAVQNTHHYVYDLAAKELLWIMTESKIPRIKQKCLDVLNSAGLSKKADPRARMFAKMQLAMAESNPAKRSQLLFEVYKTALLENSYTDTYQTTGGLMASLVYDDREMEKDVLVFLRSIFEREKLPPWAYDAASYALKVIADNNEKLAGKCLAILKDALAEGVAKHSIDEYRYKVAAQGIAGIAPSVPSAIPEDILPILESVVRGTKDATIRTASTVAIAIVSGVRADFVRTSTLGMLEGALYETDEMVTAYSKEFCEAIAAIAIQRSDLFNECSVILEGVLESKGLPGETYRPAATALYKIAFARKELSERAMLAVSTLFGRDELDSQTIEHSSKVLEDLIKMPNSVLRDAAATTMIELLSPYITGKTGVADGICRHVAQSLAGIARRDTSETVKKKCVDSLERGMVREGLSRDVYSFLANALIEIDKASPGLAAPDSVTATLRNLPGNICRHTLVHYRVYYNQYFIEKTKGMSNEERYSIGLSAHHLMASYNIPFEEANVNKAVDFILQKRESLRNRQVFSPETRVVNIFHAEGRFNEEDLRQLEESAGVSPGNASYWKGAGLKEDALDRIASTVVSGKPVTICFDGHGGRNHIWLDKGLPGKEYSENMAQPEAISYRELGDKLAVRKDLSNVTILISACYSYNFCSNLVDYLKKKGVSKLPIIVSSSNFDRLSYGNMFFGSIRSAWDGHKGALTVGDIFDAESRAFEYEDFAFLLQINPEEIKTAFGLSSLPSVSSVVTTPQELGEAVGRPVALTGRSAVGETTAALPLDVIQAGFFGAGTEEEFHQGSVDQDQVEALIQQIEPLIDSGNIPIPAPGKLVTVSFDISIITTALDGTKHTEKVPVTVTVEENASIAGLYTISEDGKRIVINTEAMRSRIGLDIDISAVSKALIIHELAEAIGLQLYNKGFGFSHNTRHMASLTLEALLATKMPRMRPALERLWRERPVLFGAGDIAGTKAVAEDMYKAAQGIIPDIVNILRRGAPTYLIEPAASEEDIAPATDDNRTAEKILGKQGHEIHAKSYLAKGDWFESLKAVLSRQIPDFAHSALTDDRSRLCIRLLHDGEKTRREDCHIFIESLLKDLVPNEADRAKILSRIRYVDVSARVDHFNTAIDLFADIAMMECDRYGEGKEYPGAVPDALRDKFLALLKLSVINFKELADEVKGERNITELLEKIFNGYVLKIKPINWKTIDEWKRAQDAVLQSL